MISKSDYTNLVFAVFIIIIITISNIWLYMRNHQILENEVYHTYDSYRKIIKHSLVKNLQEIISGKNFNTYRSSVIFNKTPVTKKEIYDYSTKITPYSIEINNLQNHISIDLISLKEYLRELLPEYVIYKVNLANTEILTNDLSTSKFIKNIEYNIANNLILNITLATRELFFLYKYREIWLEQLYFFLFSLLVGAMISSVYFKTKRTLTNSAKKLRQEFLFSQENFENLKRTLIIQNTINKDFIQKATEMYLEEIDDKKYIQLFPLSLVEKSNKKINLLKFKKTIQNYFCGLYENISINVTNDVSFAYYSIGITALYQIVISTVENIAAIIHSQTDKKRNINIELLNTSIEFEFFSFPLDINKIKQLSKMTQNKLSNIFLLDFERTLLSLDNHNVSYSLKSKGNSNNFKIKFEQFSIREGNVIEFIAKN